MPNRKSSIFAAERKWFEVFARTTDQTEIMIYDYIGWGGVTAQDFVAQLQKIETPHITVSINTPGGDVFDGLAIYNALKAHKSEVTTRVDGLAASIGSVIAMAGKTILMAEASFMMIHNPWGFSMGGAQDMRDMAETLDKVGGILNGVYASRSGKSATMIQGIMDNETWMTAQEAVDAKFADEMLTSDGKTAASARTQSSIFDLTAYRNVPKDLSHLDPMQLHAASIQDGQKKSAQMRRRLALVERGAHSR